VCIFVWQGWGFSQTLVSCNIMKHSSTLKFFILFLLITACNYDKNTGYKVDSRIEYAKKWTAEIKEKILEDSNLPIDSTFFDSQTDVLLTFHKGIKTRNILFGKSRNDTLAYILYSANQDFRIIKEFCPSEQGTFESIDYKRMEMGFKEFTNCNDDRKYGGFNYKKKVGNWIESDKFGNIISQKDFGNIEQLDSLKFIKYYR
jgi:hypothetical protein